MRLSLRRIVAQRPHIQTGNCIRCQRIYPPISNVHRPTSVFQYRRYADDVKNPESKDESPRVESTGTVPDDPDIITTESQEVQKPPPSSTSQPEKSNPRQKQSSSSRGRKSSQKWKPKYSKKKAQTSKSKYPKTTTQKWKQRRYPRKAAQRSKPKPKKPSLLNVIAETSLRRRIVWNPPLKGINPAYDMALDILEEDRAHKIRVVTRLENRLTRERERGASPETLKRIENALYQQQVYRDINDPQTRWRFKNGDVDLRNPTHQYLYRKHWTESVYVGKLMQRLTTMNIIPDSLPSLTPKVEFRLRFQERKVPSRVRPRELGWRDTEAGENLPVTSLMGPPRMEIIPHYREWHLPRKYAVVMLDLDVPDVENDSFRTKLHWMVKDIVASPVKTIIKQGNGTTVVPYLPPHPFRGMKYHRYPIFIFEQPSKEWLNARTRVFRDHKQQVIQQVEQPQQVEPESASLTDGIQVSPLLTLPSSSGTTTMRTYSTKSKSKYIWSPHDTVNRDNFNLRAWANQLGLKPVGAHLVRCEWDESVPEVLRLLGIPERAFKTIKSEETSPFDFHPRGSA